MSFLLECGAEMSRTVVWVLQADLKHLAPNGHYMGRTAQLTYRRYILYIYSTNIRTEYFRHAA